MFIGHIPAGYITTRFLLNKSKSRAKSTYIYIIGLGIFASILPDLDLVYFYFFDNRQHLHHTYFPHLPAFWLVIMTFFYTAIFFYKNEKLYLFGAIFFLNIFLHLLLDTFTGHVLWLYPFSDTSFVFFDVPARHGWWVLNFILHWTFAFEIILCILAVMLHSKYKLPNYNVDI